MNKKKQLIQIITFFIVLGTNAEVQLKTSHSDLNIYYLKLANLSLGNFKDKTALKEIYSKLKKIKLERKELELPILTTQFFIIDKLKDSEEYLNLFTEIYNFHERLKLNPLKYNPYLIRKLFEYPKLQALSKEHKKKFKEQYKLIDIVLAKNIKLGSFHSDLIITKSKSLPLAKRTEYFHKEIKKYLDILGIEKIKKDMFLDVNKQTKKIKTYYQCNDEQSKNFLLDFQRSIADMFFQLAFRARLQCKYAKSLPLLKEYLTVFGSVITKNDYENALANIISVISKLKEKKAINPITSKEYEIKKYLDEYFLKYGEKSSWYKSIKKIKDLY